MTILIPALFMLLSPQTPATRSGDTEHLYLSCKAYTRVQDRETVPGDAYLADYCPGYITGYFAGLALFDEGRTICASRTTYATAARVYVAYMDRKPTVFDQRPEVGFFGAMLESYPCAAKK